MKSLIDFDTMPLGYMGMEIPQHTKETLHNYLIRGWAPGGFVESMLACDYERALYTADTANRRYFWAIAMWIRDNAPKHSWGSYETIEKWRDDFMNHRTNYVTEVEKKYIWAKLKGNDTDLVNEPPF